MIVESPAKAKTIEKFLGRRYVVRASMGHVRDLPKSQFGVDVEHDFEPKYITIRGKGDIIKELRTMAKNASRILLGPDPDREGEAIAWHLLHLLGLEEDEPCRIEFNEITKNAIQQAVKKPRKIDEDKVDAQQARRILDRLVGYNLSPLLWRKVRKGLSAGRVQSVAVRLICDREQEINEFVSEEYWTLTIDFSSSGGGEFPAKLVTREGEKIAIPNEETMKSILAELDRAEYRVEKIIKREKKRNPAPPFTTSTLQQEAYRRLNFTARKTMMVAQQLYEGLDIGLEGTVGLISYIRTDSTRISPIAQAEARSYIENKFGSAYVPPEPRQFTMKGKAQDAHEGIRPTSVAREPEAIRKLVSPEQYKLYKLIWERFLASQMNAAILDTTTIDIAAGPYGFRATGSVVRFPGFMQVYIESRDDGAMEDEGFLPELAEGERLMPAAIKPKQHFTQPPPRYTEATLVKTLEERGIGRPSTYAPTIDTIISRGYVVRRDKQLFPTELGFIVVEMLKKYFPDIIDIEFTAGMEEKLDLIEEGKLSWKEVIREFYQPFLQTLKQAEEQIGAIELADEITEHQCEHCGRFMVIKHGPFGKFLACPGFPECRNTKPILEEIGVKCPRCAGPIVLRHTKKGRKFYGCSNYPECDFVSWDLPTNQRCPQCGNLLVQKGNQRQGWRLVCTEKTCQYQEIINDLNYQKDKEGELL